MRCEWRRRCRSKSSGEPMILFRSLFLQLLVPFVLALSVLLFIISINTINQLIVLIVDRGVSVGSVSLMLLYRLPQFVTASLPYATVLTATLLMVRISQDSELLALQSAGMGFWRIGKAIFVFSLLVSCLGLLITTVIQPYAYGKYEEEKLKLLKKFTVKAIQPGTLYYDIPGKVMYVDKIDGEVQKGVFIADREFEADMTVAFADEGVFEFGAKQQEPALRLTDGVLHQTNEPSEYRTIQFGSLRYILNLSRDLTEADVCHGGCLRPIWQTPTLELIRSDSQRAAIELMERLAIPFGNFALAIAMISLGAHHPRKGSVQVYLRMLCLVMTYYIVWLTTAENARYGQWPPAGVWAAPVLVTLYALLSLFMMDSVRKPWEKTKN